MPGRKTIRVLLPPEVRRGPRAESWVRTGGREKKGWAQKRGKVAAHQIVVERPVPRAHLLVTSDRNLRCCHAEVEFPFHLPVSRGDTPRWHSHRREPRRICRREQRKIVSSWSRLPSAPCSPPLSFLEQPEVSVGRDKEGQGAEDDDSFDVGSLKSLPHDQIRGGADQAPAPWRWRRAGS
eukprot:767577-Hanusia_phi.AAC.11